MLLGSAAGFGEPATPTSGIASGTHHRTHTLSGVPLAEPITVEAQGRTFRLPAGYLDPWPGPDALGRVNKRKSLSFAFWMPSRRYPETNRLNTASYQPGEAGRELPSKGEYIVEVDFVKFDASKEPGQLTPKKEFENHVSLDGVEAFAFAQHFGLTEYWNTRRPNPFTNYREVEGTQPRVRLRCNRPDDNVPNPLCDGTVHFEDLDLQFWIRFSRRNIDSWRDTTSAARDLIVSWQVD